jgi:hypothetical protein
MLRTRRDPNREFVYVRGPYRPGDFVPTPDDLSAIMGLGWMSVREYLASRETPLGDFFIEKVERDGKTWWRFCHRTHEWCILVEDSDVRMDWRDTRVLPPEEARAVSRSYDPRRDHPVIDLP